MGLVHILLWMSNAALRVNVRQGLRRLALGLFIFVCACVFGFV